MRWNVLGVPYPGILEEIALLLHLLFLFAIIVVNKGTSAQSAQFRMCFEKKYKSEKHATAVCRSLYSAVVMKGFNGGVHITHEDLAMAEVLACSEFTRQGPVSAYASVAVSTN